MAHLQYMPGDPRLVDQLVYELKSKGIFDQFRKDCIADVDTRPAYQNLRQRVENSVSSFLARQVWKPDLNKNQLREKLRKHILDGNYLEQGVERIVDQVVNPKLATVFVPKVEDLVYDYLGITRKKNSVETSNGIADLLPTDLEAVSPGSVKSNDDKDEPMEVDGISEPVYEQKQEEKLAEITEKVEEADTSGVSELTIHDSNGSNDKNSIPLPAEEIRPEDIPPPENSPPKIEKLEIDKIELPKEPDVATDIPLPDEIPKQENGTFLKTVNSDDDDSSSDSSLRRNMSPLTPIRSYNNENSCDAQQAFENQLIECKKEEINEPSTFRFALDTKSTENSLDAPKLDHKNESDLSNQLNQVNIDNFVTPAYEDSSNSNNLQIDYESDANSKVNTEIKEEADQNSEESKKEKKSSHKSSHRSREHKHSARDKKSESKPSSSRDTSRHDKKSKDDGKHKPSEKERSKDRGDRKENKDSSRHRSSHKSSHKDSKSHRSSSSSHRQSNRSDDKKSSSANQKDKEKSSDKSSSKDKHSKDSKSSSHHADRDRKSSSSSKSRSSDKDKDKKSKKDTDDHYSLSGRGNPNRRSTDRDSNDGSSSSKGSHQPSSSKSSESKKGAKESTSKSDSKSDNTSGSGSTTPSDKEAPHDVGKKAEVLQNKPIVRLETHLETPVAAPPRLPFVPDITLKKPKIAANFEEAKKIMKMRKFLEEEQRRMNQEAALLLEFQANVRPSLSQVYSSIPGPELEFACNTNTANQYIIQNTVPSERQRTYVDEKTYTNAELYEELNAGNETEISDEEQETISQKIEVSSESDKTNKTLSGDLPISEIKGQSNVIKVPNDDIPEMQLHEKDNTANKNKTRKQCKSEENLDVNKKEVEKDELHFFADHEKYNSELEKTKYTEFLTLYIKKTNLCNKLYLINCDTYEENVLKDVASTFGDFDIVSYHKNGQLKMPKTKAIVKNLNLTAEVSLPIDSESRSSDSDIKCQVFSPGKSDCSFELSNDYDAKLQEMVNKTSRKEIMQIIFGDIIDGSPSKMPKIDYITESNIDNAIDCSIKRKINDNETSENNNRPVLTPHKIRKMSTSELITSTTQDTEEPCTDNLASVRSKYLGRAKRVGLSRPKRTELPNSPSSDKSVENYEQNTPTKTSNGKIKAPRHMVQRYETSDLYKPKLHFLSRRNVS
ncbi:biorientation of chromosomes in cell division protein 1-like 1 isoform X1 [Pieris brassicae]|uniref:biorientation of chromosomes in cell division protein 1-like 1 isoform X1 n=2 Tax=Pieris brassicae TaxID=7116 RepID=UPI001E65F862|nr:biorientation of chromosomes in cell division protein 1-like 1 isoform X1 [Pieris brassicae]